MTVIIFVITALTSCSSGSGVGSTIAETPITVPTPSPHRATTVAFSVTTNSDGHVSLTPAILLQFSESMNINTLNLNNIQLRSLSHTGTIISTTKINVSSSNSVILMTSIPLDELHDYHVVIGSGVKDIYNNHLIGESAFAFKTGDFTAPNVVVLSPKNNESGLSTTPIIQLQFSESMDIATINSINIKLHANSESGLSVPITNIALATDNRVNFTPGLPLQQLTKYYIEVSSNIKDLGGNKLMKPMISNFTIGDFDAPNVALLVPSNNESNTTIKPIITLQFSESMNLSTINSSNIQIKESGVTGATITLSSFSAGSNNTYSFIPMEQLKDQTIYIISMSSNITDLVGNNLLNTESYSFKTGIARWGITNNILGDAVQPTEIVTMENTMDKNLYVAYTEKQSNTLMLAKFNGLSWAKVGNAISSGVPHNPSLAFNYNDNSIYLTYSGYDFNSSDTTQRAMVKRYDGNNWSYVGGNQFVTGSYSPWTNIAINPINHQPYVAISDGIEGVASVMMFNGVNWVYVGNKGFSEIGQYTDGHKILFNNIGQLYVAYHQSGSIRGVTLKQFSGNMWNDVGYQLTADYMGSFLIDPITNIPYIANISLGSYAEIGYFSGKKGNSWSMFGTGISASDINIIYKLGSNHNPIRPIVLKYFTCCII